MRLKRKPAVATTVLVHGGKRLAVPVLSAPVGFASPALKAKYPRMNQSPDLEIVDYYLSAFEAVRDLGPTAVPNEIGLSRLFGIIQNVQWGDRDAAIKSLQAGLPEITDDEEKQNGLIKPGGATLIALVDLGDAAEQLLGDDQTPGYTRYIHPGSFDRVVFGRTFSREFGGAVCPGATFDLLGMMERDDCIIDIRWMAYMLATTYKESGRRMRPVDEIGRGNLGVNNKNRKATGQTALLLASQDHAPSGRRCSRDRTGRRPISRQQ